MNKIFVVGIGPGGREQMTGQALAALDEAQVLCGYTKYIELVRPLYPDKEVCQTPMTRELERCRMALELARSGRLTDAASLVPEYHRLSQAERERLEKERNKGE